jgi:hypothetical protein
VIRTYTVKYTNDSRYQILMHYGDLSVVIFCTRSYEDAKELCNKLNNTPQDHS